MSAPPAEGLAPFDEPVFLDGADDPSAVAMRRTAQQRHVAGFLARSATVAVLAGVLPLLTERDVSTLGWAMAFGYLPVVTSADRLRRHRPGAGLLRYAVLAADFALLAAIDLTLEASVVVLPLGLAACAFHAWDLGRVDGTIAVLLLTVTVVASTPDPTATTALSAVTGALGGIFLVGVVADQSLRHSAATIGLELAASRAAAILEGIGDAIVTTTPDGHVRQVNAAAVRMFTARPAESAGRSCAGLLELTDGDRPLDCSDGCAVLRRGAGTAVEVWRRNVRGERQPLLVSCTELHDEKGAPVEVIHSFRDIRAIKAADEAKTMFLATTSHELKSPLTVIRGFARLLRDRDALSPEAYDHAVAAIGERSQELGEIVERLLLSSRIEAGQVEVDPGPHDLGAIVAPWVRDFDESHEPSIELSLADGDLVAWIDPLAITTILGHLLENAVKYSPDAGPVVVRVRPDDEALVLEVEDHGIGMDDEQVERCFDRFWQAEGADTRRFGGSGLGLYIVRSLVDALHGRVTVRSVPGVGTTFSVAVPRRPADAAEPPDDRMRRDGPRRGETSMIREFMRQVGGEPVEETVR